MTDPNPKNPMLATIIYAGPDGYEKLEVDAKALRFGSDIRTLRIEAFGMKDGQGDLLIPMEQIWSIRTKAIEPKEANQRGWGDV